LWLVMFRKNWLKVGKLLWYRLRFWGTLLQQPRYLFVIVCRLFVAPAVVDKIQQVGNLNFRQIGHSWHVFGVGFTIYLYGIVQAVSYDTGQFFTIFAQIIGVGKRRNEGAQTYTVVHVTIGASGFIYPLTTLIRVGFTRKQYGNDGKKNNTGHDVGSSAEPGMIKRFTFFRARHG
jgi:hypothetical protein